MQIPPGDNRPPRFYHLHLQEDLLEGWTLMREWGFQGAGGRLIREHFKNQSEAETAMLAIRDQQLRKGYQIVFMQAQEARS